MQQNPNKKLLIKVLTIAFAALLALSILYIWSIRNNLSLSQPFAANASFAQAVDDKTIYYFSGSGFVSYDLETHRTTELSLSYSLPTNVSDIKWAKNGAFMRASGYSTTDQLYTQLVLKGLTPNQSYWWLFDFTTGKIILVGDGSGAADVIGVAWQNGTLPIYSVLVNNEQAILRADTGAEVAKLGNDALVVAATNKSLTYLKAKDYANELITRDLTANQETVVSGNVLTTLASGSDGSCLFLVQNTEPQDPETIKGELKLYDASNNKVSSLQPDFTGNATWQIGQNKWLAVGYNQSNKPVVSAQFKAGSHENFNVNDSREQGKNYYLRAAGITTDNLVLVDSTKQMLYASHSPVGGLPTPQNADKLKEGYAAATFTVGYDQDANQFAVTILTNPYEDTKQTAISYLRGQGYDINQLNLKWYANDGVATGFELPADAAPLEEPVVIDTVPYYGGE